MGKESSTFFEIFRSDEVKEAVEKPPEPPSHPRKPLTEVLPEGWRLMWVWVAGIMLVALAIAYSLGYSHGRRRGSRVAVRSAAPTPVAPSPVNSAQPARTQILSIQLYSIRNPTEQDIKRAEEAVQLVKRFIRDNFPSLAVIPYHFVPRDRSYLAVRVQGFKSQSDPVSKEFFQKIRQVKFRGRKDFQGASWVIVTR